MPRPSKDVPCVTCAAVVTTGFKWYEGIYGRKCPDGHVSTAYELKVGRKTSVDRRQRAISNLMCHSSAGSMKLTRTETLETALRSVITSYEVLVSTVQSMPVTLALVEGALDRTITVAKEVL